MRKILLLLIACVFICLGAYRWGDTKWESAKKIAIEYIYVEASRLMLPGVQTYGEESVGLFYQDIESVFAPIQAKFRATRYEVLAKEEVFGQDESTNTSGDGQLATDHMQNLGDVDDTTISESVTDSIPVVGDITSIEKKVVINRVKLQDFDYLRQNFYQVDNTTTIGSDQLNVEKLLGKDMTLAQNVKGPQILIYHTHSQEAYADSVPRDASTSVVAIGDYLEVLLEQNYGIEVLHHKGQYDVEKRDSAYANALPDLERILQENPSIEVVIDLHRDGVPEDRHLVTEINGKPTAQIMFFNGLSRTTAKGNLEYLANPYIEDNLALSFQMQLTAAEYYPGLTRKIYLKGYRYNMHLCPKSLLIEVGAQTNTFAEAKNAMEPLADILAKVFTEKTP